MASQENSAEGSPHHVPAFRLQEDARCTWVCDGEQRLALYDPTHRVLDWWAYVPGAPLVDQPECPVHYDSATRLNVGAALMWCLNNGGNTPPDEIACRWEVEPDGVTLFVDGAYADGGHTRHSWHAWYDAKQGRYRYRMSADLRVRRQADIEFVNYYPAGMLHSDPAHRRFTHTLWRGEEGQWHALPHNSALISGHRAGYKKYLPAREAEFGMVADPHENPFCRVIESSRPMYISTCDQWWDEHLIVPMPSMHEREEGFFHSWATVEWISRPQSEAVALLSEAEEIPIFDLDLQQIRRVAFRMNEVCDFEQDADLIDAANAMCWAVDMVPGACIIDDPPRAHGGRRALALTAREPARRIAPHGANVQVGPGRKGRLTAWVNTEDLQGEAWIELRSYRFRFDQIERSYATRRLPGGTGWTQLVIEGVTADSPYLHPFLWTEGAGEALFDDILFEALP